MQRSGHDRREKAVKCKKTDTRQRAHPCGVCTRPIKPTQAKTRIVCHGADSGVTFHRECLELLKARMMSSISSLKCPGCHARFHNTDGGECLVCGRTDLYKAWGRLQQNKTCFVCGLEIFRSIHSHIRFEKPDEGEYCCHNLCARKAQHFFQEQKKPSSFLADLLSIATFVRGFQPPWPKQWRYYPRENPQPA